MSGLTGLGTMRKTIRVSSLGKRYLSKTPQPLSLTSTSPLIRPLAGPSDAINHEAIQRDFRFWPSFFTEDESSEILRMALWKLNRADSTRRRKRKGQGDQANESSIGLQGLFEGEYGFEEVSFVQTSTDVNT
jgi:alkylated DNA repair protein alkB family protein 7